MCGILGLWSKTTQVDESTVKRARDSMLHRGPDDAGIFIDKENNIGFVHRRLSIIDLSESAHQPMFNKDGRICIIYNGEICNFSEIRDELINKGYVFKSRSDTEVILKAYEEWGVNSFNKFNGMFSFSIWDRIKKLLFLVRDPFGIKPLYYFFNGNILIFSSEIRTFKTLSEYINFKENPDWKIYFLTFGFIPNPYTTLQNVYLLKKGHYLIFSPENEKIDIKRYYKLEISNNKKDINEISDTFTKVVRRHLISDAPIGVFLSGGIDSSLITLVAHNFQKDNLRTLSVIFKEKEFSEEKYQNLVLSKIKSRHNFYLITAKDLINNFDNILFAMDQPTNDGINTYFISKFAKEDGLKTVISGLGGDELFYGYGSFSKIEKLFLLKNIHNLSVLAKFLPLYRYKKTYFLKYFEPVCIYLFFRGFFIPEEAGKILNIEAKYIWEKIFDVNIELDKSLWHYPRKFLSFLEMEYYLSGQLLKDSDFMSMANSIEIRVPFLDRELVELSFNFDDNKKYNPNQPKFLITEDFKNLIPKEIIFRKKQGFIFPFKIWFNLIPEVKIYLKRYGWPRGWAVYLANKI